jgi:F-type H+-transporting ATPase subunit a
MGEEQILGVTRVVNALLGKPALALLALLHITPDNPEYPITNSFSMELLVVLLAVLFFLWLKARISVDRPGPTQQTMEFLITNPMGVGVKDLVTDMVGHGAERHVALFGTIGIFILFSNLISLVPGFASPTATTTVPLGCAIIVFLYYNRLGISHHGPVGYAKTLMGPVPLISPLMVLVETISHFARLLSLTVRLWANMMVSELIYVSFLGLSLALFGFLNHLSPVGYASAVVPVAIPLAMALLHVFVAVLQAFVFVMLSILYLGLAVSEEH